MIIYIHGFGGSGEGSKVTLLRPLFRSDGITRAHSPELESYILIQN
jgi:hypothetical protein